MEKIKTLVPKAGSAYSHGWQVMKENFISLFLVSLIVAFIGLPLGLMTNFSDFDGHGFESIALGMIQIFTLAYAIFILSPAEYGVKLVYVKAARGENFEVKDMFDVLKNYLNVILAALLSGAIISFGFIFFLVPGIVFACRLAFVPYLVMDKKLDPVKAVEESWRLTKGHGWRIFGMGIMAFFIIIAGLIVLVFGVFVSAMWISSSFAALYHAVLEEKGENIVPNGSN